MAQLARSMHRALTEFYPEMLGRTVWGSSNSDLVPVLLTDGTFKRLDKLVGIAVSRLGT
jgi:hypothetical protein